MTTISTASGSEQGSIERLLIKPRSLPLAVLIFNAPCVSVVPYTAFPRV